MRLYPHENLTTYNEFHIHFCASSTFNKPICVYIANFSFFVTRKPVKSWGVDLCLDHVLIVGRNNKAFCLYQLTFYWTEANSFFLTLVHVTLLPGITHKNRLQNHLHLKWYQTAEIYINYVTSLYFFYIIINKCVNICPQLPHIKVKFHSLDVEYTVSVSLLTWRWYH